MGILRRLREWREDKNGTLIGPNIDADSLNTETANINTKYQYNGSDLYSSNDFVEIQILCSVNNSDISSTSSTYEKVGSMRGVVDANIPDAATLYGNYVIDLSAKDDGETSYSRPRVLTESRNFKTLDELEITKDGISTGVRQSGWTEITSVNADQMILGDLFQLKTDNATNGATINGGRAGLAIGWRL